MKISKNIKSLQTIGISLLLVLVTACRSVESEQETIQTTGVDNPASCEIALSAHIGNNKSDKTIQKFQQWVAKKDYDPNYLEKLGWAYVNKAQTSFDPGFYKLAEQTVECMNTYQPNSFSALLLRGHIKHNLHQFKEAESIARQLVDSRGYWFEYALLGDALMEQGELNSAAVAYQEMMNQKPGPQAYNRAAYLRWLKGDVDGALELLNLSAISYVAENNVSRAWTLTRIADFEFQSGHFDVSLMYLSEVLKKQPQYAPALLLQGRIYMAQGTMDKAIDILSTALQLNPLPAYRWALLEALSEKPGNQSKRAELEQQLFKTGEIEDRRTTALYLASMGINPEKAVSLAQQELKQRQDVFTLDTLAWALRANDQLEEAEKVSKQALLEGTRSARLFYHAGVIAYENGQLEEAKGLLKQAKADERSLLPSEKKHLNQFL